MLSLIKREEVIRMAELARLELSEEEIDLYWQDLNSFLVSGRKLQQVDVSGIEGTSHAMAVSSPLRSDRVGESLPQDAVLAAGPEVMDGYFKVPRIVEEQQ
ncbi:MAG TPA: Asp-tRNA(Asn)/Glu-tRNA(Gln) amidotransferase subunit GatB [Firmicutes bacterium]|nr:Asp-tRNA(Asn)/Glu-tRNA(Gln) amidotransferase subunit GatB [Bacillota bacterium]